MLSLTHDVLLYKKETRSLTPFALICKFTIAFAGN